MKKKYIILILFFLLILLFVFAIKKDITGSAIDKYKIYNMNEGLIEIDESELNTCSEFYEDGVLKVCVALEGFSCKYCEDYINNKTIT